MFHFFPKSIKFHYFLYSFCFLKIFVLWTLFLFGLKKKQQIIFISFVIVRKHFLQSKLDGIYLILMLMLILFNEKIKWKIIPEFVVCVFFLSLIWSSIQFNKLIDQCIICNAMLSVNLPYLKNCYRETCWYIEFDAILVNDKSFLFNSRKPSELKRIVEVFKNR